MDVFNGNIGARVKFEYSTTARGTLRGTVRTDTTEHLGIYVAEGGAELATDQEVTTGAPLLYTRPVEPFITKKIIGDNVTINGALYEIVGWGEGRRQMDNRLLHIELTLSEVGNNG